MAGRMLGLGVRLAILLTFAVFFIAPVVWLLLAPTKSDEALITSSPFSFGDFHHVVLAVIPSKYERLIGPGIAVMSSMTIRTPTSNVAPTATAL